MYVPRHFRVDDRDTLESFIRQNEFATLIVAREDNVDVNHVPLNLEGNAIVGHVAAPNPIVEAIRAGARATAVFYGPHAYISPRWYPSARAVPTWNYAVVHVTGRLTELSREENIAAIRRLVARFEDVQTAPFAAVWDDESFWKQVGGTLGFRLEIESMVGKFKLSQNRTDEDRLGAIEGLELVGQAEIATMMRHSLLPTSTSD